MADSKIGDIFRGALDGIKELVDVNTVIGEPVTAAGGTVIIPVSKVSVGFASGGLDYLGKSAAADSKNPSNFGAGGGTGMTVSPVGFLIVKADGEVELLNVAFPTGPAAAPDIIETVSSLIEKSPEIIQKLRQAFAKDKDESKEKGKEKGADK